MNLDSAQSSSRILYLLLGVIGICILLNYIFLRGVYQPHNTDNTFSYALIHDYIVDGIADDPFTRRGPSSWVQDGLKYFRRTHALIYGSILSISGWGFTHAQNISAVLVMFAGGLWLPILNKLNYRLESRLVFVALFFFLEFSFMASNSFRQEAFLLLLQSLAFYLALARQYFAVGLLSALAFETHPIGIMNLALPASWVFARHIQRRAHDNLPSPLTILLKLMGGIVAGCLYYFLVYNNNGLEVVQFLLANTGQVDENVQWKHGALSQYFFATKYYRHLPELLLLLVSLYYFISHKIYKDRLFIILSLIAVTFLSFIRDNFFYAIVAYPVFLLVIVTAFDNLNKLSALLTLCLLLMVPQYSYVYYLNHGWDRETYLKAVKETVPNDDLPVVGSTPSWFALMDRNFKDGLSRPESFDKLNFKEFYLLEDRFTRDDKAYKRLLDHIQSNYDGTMINDVDKNGYHLTTKKMVARNSKAP